MKLGFAKKEITPPAGLELGGYAGYRPNCGVHDPLFCKVILLEQGDGRYALVVLDLMCADESLCAKIAAAVEPLGISKERLIVSAIHSHAAPAGVIGGQGALVQINTAIVPENPAFAEYMQAVVHAAAEACFEAARTVEPFVIRAGQGAMPPVGSERHTGAQPKGILTAAEFGLQSGKKLIFYNFPCHPTVLSAANLLVSADFAGQIEKYLDADLTVFANGAAGDISTRFTRKASSFEECERMGALAAAYVRNLLEPLPFEKPKPLRGKQAHVTLAARKVQPVEEARKQLEETTLRWQQAVKDGLDAGQIRILKSYVEGAGVNLEFAQNMAGITEFSVPVTVFRFAGLPFATVPGEFYSTLLPENTAAICYAGGYYRYIADENAYAAGHYEAMAAVVAQGSGEKLSKTIRQMLEQIKMEEML